MDISILDINYNIWQHQVIRGKFSSYFLIVTCTFKTLNMIAYNYCYQAYKYIYTISVLVLASNW